MPADRPLTEPWTLQGIRIPNRVGQDVRYSLDDSRIRTLGWKPTRNFDEALKKIAFGDDFKRFL